VSSLDLHLWPRQMEAFETRATELFFGGATRGGKSHLVRVALIAWCMGIGKLQCVLIRKKFDDILSNHVYGPGGFMDMLAPLIKTGQAKVTQHEISFGNGSRIAFKHCQDERQFESAQGIASHVLVIDEATQISERLIRSFRAWCTMPEEMKATLPAWAKDRFPRIIYTANPIGASLSFFRRQFVKARQPETIEKVDGFLRQYLPSRVRDNPSENEEATRGRVQGLHGEAMARALLEGDFDAPLGDFYPEWDEDRHVIADFEPPEHWYRYRSYDWGVADPSVCYFVAVSDGEPFKDTQGRERWFPRGAIIFYNESYFCDAEDPSKGARMSNEQMATAIRSASDINANNVITLTDSKPFQDVGGDGPAKTFAKCGVPLTMADTSRVAGWSQLRSRLIGKEWDNGKFVPMIYFTERCVFARDYLPALPRHPSESKREDAAEHGEPTHVCDAIRYACMAHNNAVIKDLLEPLQSRIDRAVNMRPSFKHMMSDDYPGIFS
jgi:hypothetical protein